MVLNKVSLILNLTIRMIVAGPKADQDMEYMVLGLEKLARRANIGAKFSRREKELLTKFLQEIRDEDMLGIDPNVICHKLHGEPKFKTIFKKKRNHGPEWGKIIETEIEKLKNAGFIMEFFHL
ncbi:hypothetical protein DVH24_034159 [Malus domestica]|uniref:Uncharacterized protein n=1 Tax=Malus domestica TaxID=3750 RepID=A0A498I9Q4_MALDO|nr:hypothetical protein DVH24_034159 [Malus domestica]